MRRVIPWIMVILLWIGSSDSYISSVEGACTTPTPYTNTTVVNVAVLLYLVNQPMGLFLGNISDTLATSVPGYGLDTIQPYQLAVDLYVKKMRARDGILPLPNGQTVKVNYVYINLAGPGLPGATPTTPASALAADYSVVLPEVNFPRFIYLATVPGVFPLQTSAVNSGLFTKLISTNPTVLQNNFGITTPFTYIVPPALFIDPATTYLANLVENAQSHVIVHPFIVNKEMFVCDGLPPLKSLTPDCLAPTFARNRRGGARRYTSVFTAVIDTTQNQNSALESMFSLGIKSIVTITDDLSPFSAWAAKAVAVSAESLNIKVLKKYTLWPSTNCDPTLTPGNVTDSNCSPIVTQRQVFQNKTTDEIALELKNLNADALIIVAASRSSGAWTLAQLFPSMRSVGYTPKAISWGGGIDIWLEKEWISDASDLVNTWTTKPWSQHLKGPNYQNVLTDTQFELLPSNGTHEGPWMLYEAYENAYGPNRIDGGGTAHPMYYPKWTENGLPALGWQAMSIVQKLIENAGTLDAPTILQTAPKLGTPGNMNQISFDQYGRITRVNPVLVQKRGADNEPLILAPVNIATPDPIYPLPTWEERFFQPMFYQESNEKILVALTAVSIFLCTVLTGLVLFHWKAPVIRAATPSFCLLTILGGIVMLTSNFFATLVVDDTHCAASVWLLTLGFTILFSSLFTKTFRIWKIFAQKKLQVLKLKDSELLLPVVGFLIIDIIINATWMGTAGMNSAVIVTDPERPSKNYLTCDFADGAGAIYTHLAVKGAILLFGVGLTYAVRNTPSAFNESTLIGLSIYNVSFVVCFIIPIISSNLGGRETVYLIRGFAIIFVVLSSMGLLYVPKILAMSQGSVGLNTVGKTQAGGNNTTITPTSPTNKEKQPQLRLMHSGSGTGSGGMRVTPLSPGSGPTRNAGYTQQNVVSVMDEQSIGGQHELLSSAGDSFLPNHTRAPASSSNITGLPVPNPEPEQDHVRPVTPPVTIHATTQEKYEVQDGQSNPEQTDPGLNTVNSDV